VDDLEAALRGGGGDARAGRVRVDDGHDLAVGMAGVREVRLRGLELGERGREFSGRGLDRRLDWSRHKGRDLDDRAATRRHL